MIDVNAESILEFAKRLDPEAARRLAESVFETLAGGTERARDAALACIERSWPSARYRRWTAQADVSRSGEDVVGTVTVAHPWVRVLFGGEDVPPHPIASNRPMHLEVGKHGERPKRWKRGKRAGTSPVIVSPGFGVVHPGYKGKDCLTRTFRTGSTYISRKMAFLLKRLARAAGSRSAGGE